MATMRTMNTKHETTEEAGRYSRRERPTAIDLLNDLVVGYDQGGAEISPSFIERCRAFLAES
jgi:hypothetical protein